VNIYSYQNNNVSIRTRDNLNIYGKCDYVIQIKENQHIWKFSCVFAFKSNSRYSGLDFKWICKIIFKKTFILIVKYIYLKCKSW